MSDGKMALHIDASRNLLRTVVSGFWTLDDVRIYDQRQRDALEEMVRQGCPRAEIAILVDLRDSSVHSQAVVEELDTVLSLPVHSVRKVAALLSSALVARQSRRSGPEHAIFYEEGKAIEWLLSP